jgi:hypothetical protein
MSLNVNLLSEKPSGEQLNGLTETTTVAEDKTISCARCGKTDIFLSAIVVIIIVAVF